ncbi:large-conductance mechanosensitive channel protein MscL [Corynebacterium guangdongense]|uniref:Large-conductance mechanosensitive channel n=1 Tax=Corynebacterium guangdongense TaxID=1783348 RepID=A0ABU1ZV82_9CORY|nr:large-conductance mechanosensitive channel protein MscL [Corynebacterium guangdongense]MDR7328837.1 large conductance mechanosensitive channel [Corynebacterium guangdongense]WJZ17412.1 Large-conductance mechanosensitive channel [Corynebacterium guangdongense]
MLQGFKEFIMRGNVIDLAVGVVIGAAFTGIVTAFTNALINPLVAVFGGSEINGFGIQLVEGNEATFMDFGAVISAIINFLIIAAVVYFALVLPMNKLDEAQKRRKGIDPEEVDPTEVELLAEIRDLMSSQATAAPNDGSTKL